MATFKVTTSGVTKGTFTIADSKISFETITSELAKLEVYNISDKQVKEIVETGSGVEFRFDRKSRKALPIATVKDITKEVKFHKALDIVNKYSAAKNEYVNKMFSGAISQEVFMSIVKRVNMIAENNGLEKPFK